MNEEQIKGILTGVWNNGYLAGQGRLSLVQEEAVNIAYDFFRDMKDKAWKYDDLCK